jgi:hypothetical protein
MPRYAVVNPRTLELTATQACPRRGIVVPLHERPFFEVIASGAVADEVYQRVLYDVLYPAHHRRQLREPMKLRPKGRIKSRASVSFRLAPPDPWLVALATVMWQGIIAGATWDTIKLAVGAALAKLRAVRMAPDASSTTVGAARTGFHYVQYAEGRKQREMFIALQRAYRKSQSPRASVRHLREDRYCDAIRRLMKSRPRRS